MGRSGGCTGDNSSFILKRVWGLRRCWAFRGGVGGVDRAVPECGLEIQGDLEVFQVVQDKPEG